jgi:hypothetical protein
LDYFKAKFTETPFDGVSPWFPDVSGEDFPKKTNPLFVANFPGLQEECAMAAGLTIAVASQFSWPRR